MLDGNNVEVASVRERFERQRRNLILVTTILLVFYIIGFEIDKINFLGNSATLNNAEHVDAALWLLLLYFFTRYMQYFFQVNHFEFHKEYQKTYDALVEKHVIHKFEKETDPKDLVFDPPPGTGRIEVERVDWIHSSRKNVKFSLQGVVTFYYDKGMEQGKFSDRRVELSGSILLLSRLKALLNLLVFTPVFTEYYLPFLLPILPSIAFVNSL